jgi:SAM-dependent methyltransferase
VADFLKGNKKETDSAQPDFWSKRYAGGRTPWQLQSVPAILRVFVRSLPIGSDVLIPGCGEDYQTIDTFRRAGHRITAIDFSPVAIDHTRKMLPDLRDRIILADFFSYNFGNTQFDVIYERTFLCSLPPRLWNDYAHRVAQLLRPGGILAGFFFYGEESDPPPYPLTEQAASKILGASFDLLKSEPVTDSLPVFAGKEKWHEWRRR